MVCLRHLFNVKSKIKHFHHRQRIEISVELLSQKVSPKNIEAASADN